MPSKVQTCLRIAAILLATLALGMQLQVVIIPVLNLYQFWMAMLAFFLLFISRW